ncbi:MAG: hypothetical protein IIA73_02160 [Proteobacteria bacterium]|nr:hypothetical protein [Pseudomonadota bacterium]
MTLGRFVAHDNDWDSLMTLSPRIDSVLGPVGTTARAPVIDDGSDVMRAPDLRAARAR